MADVDLSAMTGADLTAFRAAMLRAGVMTFLGRANAVDFSATGDVGTITIPNVGPLAIVGLGVVNPVGLAIYDANVSLYTAASGGGTMVAGNILSNGEDGSVDNYFSILPTPIGATFAAPTLYIRNQASAVFVCDVLLYGIYANPA